MHASSRLTSGRGPVKTYPGPGCGTPVFESLLDFLANAERFHTAIKSRPMRKRKGISLPISSKALITHVVGPTVTLLLTATRVNTGEPVPAWAREELRKAQELLKAMLDAFQLRQSEIGKAVYASWERQAETVRLWPNLQFRATTPLPQTPPQWNTLVSYIESMQLGLKLLPLGLANGWKLNASAASAELSSAVEQTRSQFVISSESVASALPKLTRETDPEVRHAWEIVRLLALETKAWFGVVQERMASWPRDHHREAPNALRVALDNHVFAMMATQLSFRALHMAASTWLFSSAIKQDLLPLDSARKIAERVCSQRDYWVQRTVDIGHPTNYPEKVNYDTAAILMDQAELVARCFRTIDHRASEGEPHQLWEALLLLESSQITTPEVWQLGQNTFKERGIAPSLLQAGNDFLVLHQLTSQAVRDQTFNLLASVAAQEQRRMEEEAAILFPQKRIRHKPKVSRLPPGKTVTLPPRPPSPEPEPATPVVEPATPVIEQPRTLMDKVIQLTQQMTPPEVRDHQQGATIALRTALRQLTSLTQLARKNAWTLPLAQLALDSARLTIQSLLDLLLCQLPSLKEGDHPLFFMIDGHPLYSHHDLLLLTLPLTLSTKDPSLLALLKSPLIEEWRESNTALWYRAVGQSSDDPWTTVWLEMRGKLTAAESNDQEQASRWLEEVTSKVLAWTEKVIDLAIAPTFSLAPLKEEMLIDALESLDVTSDEPLPVATKKGQTEFRKSLVSTADAPLSVEQVSDIPSAVKALDFLQTTLHLTEAVDLLGRRERERNREYGLRNRHLRLCRARCEELKQALAASLFLNTPHAYPSLLAVAARLATDLMKALLLHLPLYSKGTHLAFMTTLESEVIERTTLIDTTDLSLLSKVVSQWKKYVDSPLPDFGPLPQLDGPLWAKLRRIMTSPLHTVRKADRRYQGCETLFHILDLANSMGKLHDGFDDEGFQRAGTSLEQYKSQQREIQRLAEPLLWRLIGLSQALVHRILGQEALSLARALHEENRS